MCDAYNLEFVLKLMFFVKGNRDKIIRYCRGHKTAVLLSGTARPSFGDSRACTTTHVANRLTQKSL